MGTVVFPEADFKFFLTAPLAVRARRRYAELLQSGQDVRLEEVQRDMARRDARDRKRALAPLRPAPGARIVETGQLTVEEILNLLLSAIACPLRQDGRNNA
jgi:cytidylate kinase